MKRSLAVLILSVLLALMAFLPSITTVSIMIEAPRNSDLGYVSMDRPVKDPNAGPSSDSIYMPELAEEEIAKRLYFLGYLSGTADDSGNLTFETEKNMTRLECAILVVRLLGIEDRVLKATYTAPYVDVPEWGKPYVDYLYENGLVETKDTIYFNPDKDVNYNTFVKYILYILGYSFDGSDYTGKLPSQFGAEIKLCETSFSEITRGKAFSVIYRALNTTVRGDTKLLSERLVEAGKLTYNDAVFLLWSSNEKATEEYALISGYHVEKMLPEGYYSIVLADSALSLNVLVNGSNMDYEGVGVTLWKDTKDVSQKFRLEMTERGTYMLYAACSRGGYNRVVGFGPYSKTAALYHSTSPYAAEFYIKSTGKEDGSWRLIPANMLSSVVTCADSTAPGSKIYIEDSETAEGGSEWIFIQDGTVNDDGDEVAIFPSNTLYISQGAYDGFSHSNQNALDIITMSGRAFSPFTGTIVRMDPGDYGCNAVWVQSNNKVVYADGTVDYMTVVFMHDNYIGDLYVGQVIRQGEGFYDMGTAGYATGKHIHIYCYRGKYPGYMPFTGSGDVNVEDALVLLPDTMILKDKGLNWRVYNGK